MENNSSDKDSILRGGQFIVKETKCENVFTPEDFSEEQKMMRDSVREFTDRELWANKERFENKDYAFTKEVMQKAGGTRFVEHCRARRIRRNGNGFCHYHARL